MKKKADKTKARDVARFDKELALTNDMLDIAHRLSMYGGWRVSCRAIYYVLMRVSDVRGRKQLAAFLDDSNVGW